MNLTELLASVRKAGGTVFCVPAIDPDTAGDQRATSTGAVLKLDEEKHIVWGWFSVIEEDGQAVIDKHGHIIEADVLQKAAHEFVLDSRAGKVMHNGTRVADVVDTIVFTKELQAALGIDLKKVGWFGGMQIRDPALWARVQKGDLPAFSIGGYAKEIPA